MTSRVYFRGSRDEARAIINEIRHALTGQGPDNLRVAAGCFIALGFAALSDIKADFVRKARGGVGEDGVKWQPLSPKTLAYSRRFGPGEKAALKRAAGLGKGHRFAPGGNRIIGGEWQGDTYVPIYGGNTGLLNAAQMKKWKLYFVQALAWLITKYPEGQAKAIAAGIAWNKIKAEGGQTKLAVYGNRPHEILRDTGVLLNSLSPGEIGSDGATYRKPEPEEGGGQIFAVLSNGVIVGTNVKYAATHQYGDAKRKIPARPFLPEKTPEVWMRRWMGSLGKALENGLKLAFQGAANAKR